jgi:O-antigen/teichoic acid export membrane protein
MSSLLIAAIGLITGVLSARVLGPVDRGNLATILFWPAMLAPLAALSLGDTLVLALRDGDRRTIADVARSVARWALLIGWPVGALLIVALTARHDVQLLGLTLLVWTVQLWEQCTTQVAGGILRHERRFLAINLIRVCLPALYVTLAVVAVLSGAGLVGFVVGFVLALATTRFIWARSVAPWFHWSRPVDRTAYRPFLERVRGLHGVTIAAMVSGNIDRIFVVGMESAVDIGNYFVALAIAAPLQAIVAVAIQSSALSYLIREGENRRAQVAARLLRITWVVAILVSLSVAAICPLVVPVVFGEDFRPAGLLASALACLFAFVPLRTAMIEILKSTGHTRALIIAEVVLIVLFAATYPIAAMASATWPVVWALAAGLIGSAALLAVYLGIVQPSARPSTWLLPSVQTAREIIDLALVVVRGRSAPL